MTSSAPPPPEPVAAALQQRIRSSFARQGLMRLLGAELVTIEPGTVTIRLENKPELSQQHGLVHAGATSAIADSAGGYAALTLLDEGDEVVTVEYKLNFLAPARGDVIETTGTVLRPGRTLTVCRLDAWAITGPERTQIATGQQTLIRVRPAPDQFLNPTVLT